MCDIILLFVFAIFTLLGSLKERRGWGGKKLDVDRIAKHKIAFSHSNLTHTGESSTAEHSQWWYFFIQFVQQ